MAICNSCSIDFPLLIAHSTCHLCKQLLDKSAPERASLKKRPQCLSCGTVYTELATKLCQPCVIHWARSDSSQLPAALSIDSAARAEIAAMRSQLNHANDLIHPSATANTVMESALQHRSRASDKRLGTPRASSRPQNANLVKAAAAGAANRTLNQSQAILHAANQKRNGSVQVAATLWKSSRGRKGEENLQELQRFTKTEQFDKTTNVLKAFTELLLKLRESYKRTYPTSDYQNITSQTVAYHAHVNKNTHSELTIEDLESMTMENLLQHFANQSFIKLNEINSRRLSIRVVIDEAFLPDTQEALYNNLDALSAQPPMSSISLISRSSNIHRASAVVMGTGGSAQDSTRLRSSISIPSLHRASAVMGSHHQLGVHSSIPLRCASAVLGSNHRTSAVITGEKRKARSPSPPSNPSIFGTSLTQQSQDRRSYVRNVELIAFNFRKIQYDADNGSFSTDNVVHEILLTKNREAHYERNQPRAADSGYIGGGSSKKVYYARFDGREYAFAQCPNVDACENAFALKAEYKNLHHAYILANEFKNELNSLGIRFPRFYVNFEGSFLGEIDTDDLTRTSFTQIDQAPTNKIFLATRLLPCGEADQPIQKFTGSENVGAPPKSSMTRLMHAFMHYTYAMTKKTFLLSDIQGILDNNNELCVIDPQHHSNSSDRRSRIYWDGGPEKMESYIAHHIESEDDDLDEGCSKNQFCNGLNLLTVKVV
ncbi:hypothetical protein D9758_009800 [Tetrapyrgos nigripes]|uniref:Alpha-type protein kinase domain-containing protein n=1 Tax=Tetrapyrgos nigripes TaxID=182062 RepID=A0A8H5GK64_9AGAR|nr:hypothetical protein D9758_009800 [Tetrapyrgos nigripes]